MTTNASTIDDRRRVPADGTMIRNHRRKLRNDRGRPWSQTDLADRAGVSKRAIQYIENGAHPTPYRSTLQAIADALGVDIAFISADHGTRR